MFDRAFFEDIKAVVDDLFAGSEEFWVTRKLVYDPAANTNSAPNPAGAATVGVLTRVSKEWIDGKAILRTDMGFIYPASGLSFELMAGDTVHLGATATAEPSALVVAVFPIRSPSTIIAYEAVLRI